MKNLTAALAAVAVIALLAGCATTETDSSEETTAAPVQYDYPALSFKVKLSYTASFTYTPRDQSDAADYVIDEFERKLESDGNSGNGYQIAQGEQPDLTVNITVNSDDSNNKTMSVEVTGASGNVPQGSSSDGRTYPYVFDLQSKGSYRDPDQMIDDLADQMNEFISSSWWKKV